MDLLRFWIIKNDFFDNYDGYDYDRFIKIVIRYIPAYSVGQA